MTEKAGGTPGGGRSRPDDGAWVREIEARLTPAERQVRNLELAEQARKFFGGLSDAERAALGIGPEQPKPPAQQASVRELGPERGGELIKSRGPATADVIWAGLSLAVFAAVLYWVILK